MTNSSDGQPSEQHHLLIWLLGLSAAPALVLFDLLQLKGIHLVKSNLLIGRDFLNVWTGGNLALTGELSKLYNYEAYIAWQTHLFGPLDPYNYSYPPHSLFLAMPFGALPYIAALALWSVLGLSFFIWAARPYMPARLHPVYAVLTPAAFVCFWWGHYGFLVGGLWLLCFSAMQRSQMRTGIIAGLLTIKPHLGILLPFVMLQRKQWIAILTAASVTLVLIALSGAAFGFEIWKSYIFDTSALQVKIMTAPGEKFYYLMMPSAYIALRNTPEVIAWGVQGCFAAMALYLAWKARAAEPKDLAFITATSTAIMLPYVFNYDLTVSSLGFAVLMYSHWAELKKWERVVLWLAFASPLLVMIVKYLAPVALLIGLFVQVRHATYRETSGLPIDDFAKHPSIAG